MAKNLVFSRNLFVRHPEHDFSDDGNYFRFYSYKDALPISVCTYQDEAYAYIRLGDLGFRYEIYKDDSRKTNICNGVAKSTFPMDLFIDTCEELYQKYVVNGAELRAKNNEIVDKVKRANEARKNFFANVQPEISFVVSGYDLSVEEAVNELNHSLYRFVKDYWDWKFSRTETREDGTVVAIFTK